MNILYIMNYAGNGGSEKYVRMVAEYMLALKHKIHFMYNHPGALRDEMEAMGIKPVKLEMKNPFDTKAAGAVAEYCRKHKIDIIHTQYQRENYIALLAKKKYKVGVIYTSHIVLRNNFVWKIMNSFMNKNNDAIIAVCEMIRDLLIQNKMPKDKITTVYNGVVLKEGAVKTQKVRNEFNIHPDEFVFVTLARMSKEKGIPFLLEALNRLKGLTHLPFKLLLAGDGEEMAVCQNYVKENNLDDRVIFMGYRTDTEDILAAGDCFINSSSSEAMSFAILEAMSMSLPLILTAVGGNTEIIGEKAADGILVNYGDVQALSDAMLKMMTDQAYREICSNSSLNTVIALFSVEQQLSQTLNIYEKVLNN